MHRLNNHEIFPNLTINAVGGATINVPQDLNGSYGVVLLYRGSWCPYCNAQLAAFSRSYDVLEQIGAKVVALSVDDEATAQATVDKHRIRFPIGFGADAHKVAQATGAYLNEDPLYLQSTGFVLDPQGKIITAVYSSDAIGRLVPDDVIGLIKYVHDHA